MIFLRCEKWRKCRNYIKGSRCDAEAAQLTPCFNYQPKEDHAKPKIDLVMWVKNGAKTLPKVLNRIEQIIPLNIINSKIAVDDGSKDKSVEWLNAYGWLVKDNLKGGISSGANQALSMVKTEYFASFEQDILLSRQWWTTIKNVYREQAVTSGVRVVSQPRELTALQLFLIHRYLMGNAGALSFKEGFCFGKTLDNTIYNTAALRSVGGFPTAETCGVDTKLAYQLRKHGLTWRVIGNVISVHLRTGFKEELQHQRSYGFGHRLIGVGNLKRELLKMLLIPPATVMAMYGTGELRLMFSYPMLKFAYLRGFLN